MAHPAPFDFEPPPMRYRDDAFRFLIGTPDIPALYAAREGPAIVAEAGIEAIREKSLRQTSRLIALAEERGWRCSTPRDPARRGGTAAVDFENALEVSRELNDRGVVVDYRPGVGIRISPHFYTEDRGARPRLRSDRRDPRDRLLAPLAGAALAGHVTDATPRSPAPRLPRRGP